MTTKRNPSSKSSPQRQKLKKLRLSPMRVAQDLTFFYSFKYFKIYDIEDMVYLEKIFAPIRSVHQLVIIKATSIHLINMMCR